MSCAGKLILELLWLACIACVSRTAIADERPNVVVILTDDQGWGDLSAHGNTAIRTPSLDSLAADGATFERFFVCPVCSPTRAEFLTGRYYPRTGVRGVSAGDERMNLDEVTIAQKFRGAGYATGMFGKWHNGSQSGYHPIRRGFDEFYGVTSGHWGNYFDPMLDHHGEVTQSSGYMADDLTDHAIQFIEQQAEARKPSFTYLAFNTPHSPMQVPDRWFDPMSRRALLRDERGADRENVEHTKAALAMCENIDWNVGRVLRKLDELALGKNTIVVFFSDNGPNGARFNGDMRGIKGSTDEGGCRSPLFMRWPDGIRRGSTVKEIASAIDLLPTLTELAGIEMTNSKPLDGRSLVPLLSATAPIDWPDRHLFSAWGGRVSVRTQTHRLDHQGKLYDMVVDSGQRNDLAKSDPNLASALVAAVGAWKKDVGYDSKEPESRPFLVDGNPSLPTQLPARDAKATGAIQRSNQYPNCSYFKEWTRVGDSIYWPVEVTSTGDYEIEIYYACPESAVGSTYVLDVEYEDSDFENAHRVESPVMTIAAANPAQERGAENDRVPRGESYVKTWSVLEGHMRLTKGVGKMSLRAEFAPSEAMIDFRLLVLRRVALR